ncbi:MAG: hypothetical protein U0401_11715 [Anaerolineae bacterium]
MICVPVCRVELESGPRHRRSASLEALAGDDILVLDEVLGARLIGANQSIGSRW